MGKSRLKTANWEHTHSPPSPSGPHGNGGGEQVEIQKMQKGINSKEKVVVTKGGEISLYFWKTKQMGVDQTGWVGQEGTAEYIKIKKDLLFGERGERQSEIPEEITFSA